MWTVQDRERYQEDGRRYPSDLRALSDWGWAVKLLLVPAAVPVGHTPLSAYASDEDRANEAKLRSGGRWLGFRSRTRFF